MVTFLLRLESACLAGVGRAGACGRGGWILYLLHHHPVHDRCIFFVVVLFIGVYCCCHLHSSCRYVVDIDVGKRVSLELLAK